MLLSFILIVTIVVANSCGGTALSHCSVGGVMDGGMDVIDVCIFGFLVVSLLVIIPSLAFLFIAVLIIPKCEIIGVIGACCSDGVALAEEMCVQHFMSFCSVPRVLLIVTIICAIGVFIARCRGS